MASISFPTTPNDGDTYTYDGITYRWYATKSQWRKVTPTINLTALETSLIPGSNVTYDLGTSDNRWRDLYLSGSSLSLGDAQLTSSGNTFVLPEGSTVGGITIGAGGASVYANVQSLPTTGLTAGNFAFVGNTLFITNGQGWYSVGVTNQSPTLSLSANSITLGDSGNTINFTYTATDPDGPTPVVTLSTDLANTDAANVTLFTSNSTVTVENLSNTDYSANITLTATDGINQTYGVVTLNVTFVTVLDKHPLWDETVLSVGTSSTNGLQNSTFIDRSTNGHTVTPTGSAVQTAFHPYLDNWSVEFDGTDDYLTFTDTGVIDFGTNDWTVEFWANVNNTGTFSPFIRPDGTGSVIEIGHDFSTNTFKVDARNGAKLQISYTFPENAWTHVAIVKNNGTLSVYINGTSIGSVSDGTTWVATNGNCRIGGSSYSSSHNINGNISNLRIVKGTAVYTANFTPPTENLIAITGTTLLTCQSNRFVDNSTNGLTLTPTGNTKISFFNPFGQDSEYASGENKGSYYRNNDSYLSVADPNNDFYLNNEQFTMEFWYYRTNSSAGSLVSKWASGYSGYRINAGATGALGFYNVTTSYNCSSLAPLNAWTHYACTRDASGNMRQFINGVLDRTDTVNPGNASGTTSLYIGTLHIFPSQGLNRGYISDFSLVKGTAKYTADFTPPTSPIGNTNATVYIPMDNLGIYDKTGNHTVTLNGDVSSSTTQTKFANSSMYFDGSGDWVSLNGLEAIGTNDFTIETWVYPTASGSSPYVFDFREVASSVAPALNFQNGTLTYISQNSYVITTSQSIELNTWAHVAVVRSSGTTTVYYNGTNVGSTSDSRVYIASNGRIGKYGAGSAGYFVGYMENFQIYNNYAKYTTNFTPPTQSQGIGYQGES